jgi:DUF4097 and DUF4098 domain-containing protein YvlB
MHATRVIAAAARLTVVVAAAAALSACDVVVNSLEAKGQAKDQWTRTYSISASGDVEVVNANGRIDVTGTDGTQVEVVAERTARAMTDEDAQKVLAQVQIVEAVTADRVRLETKAPTGEGGRVDVRYHVKVPASVNVQLRNSNGTVEVVAVKGKVKAETDNGTVNGRQLTGSVDANTTNGSVHLEMDGVAEGGVRAETVNGAVELTLPSSAKADLQATCVNGRVAVAGLRIDGPETTRRRVEGRLNGGGPKVVLETTNGRIQLTGR